jgi:hypothetical protein
MYENGEGHSRMWTFVVGALAGTALGLMVAPEQGRKMRRRVARSLQGACSARTLRRLRSHGRLGRQAGSMAGSAGRALRQATVAAAVAVLPRRILARLA